MTAIGIDNDENMTTMNETFTKYSRNASEQQEQLQQRDFERYFLQKIYLSFVLPFSMFHFSFVRILHTFHSIVNAFGFVTS